jgi:hypothetical protein
LLAIEGIIFCNSPTQVAVVRRMIGGQAPVDDPSGSSCNFPVFGERGGY